MSFSPTCYRTPGWFTGAGLRLQRSPAREGPLNTQMSALSMLLSLLSTGDGGSKGGERSSRLYFFRRRCERSRAAQSATAFFFISVLSLSPPYGARCMYVCTGFVVWIVVIHCVIWLWLGRGLLLEVPARGACYSFSLVAFYSFMFRFFFVAFLLSYAMH